MEKFLRRTWLEINLDRLCENYTHVADMAGEDTQVIAVVKANAYGHGAVTCAKALQRVGADYFAVSNLEEAIQLRLEDITCPILILSYTPPTEAKRLAAYHITQTVVDMQHAQALSDAACKAGVHVSVHFKVDTGMSRVGFFAQNAQECRRAAGEIVSCAKLDGLDAQGIFTHFATSDEPNNDLTEKQYARFKQVIAEIEAQGIHLPMQHCCNSAATLRFTQMHLDAVRPGIILYGLLPDVRTTEDILPLQPVMQLKTCVSLVKHVPAGTVISYGATFTAPYDMQIATVPIGYADGYPRMMADKAHMLVNGQKAPVVGRVCMDQCVLDVTDMQVAVGDEVTVFGDGLSADEYAAWLQTINYEVVCMVGRRVPRVYVQNGQTVGYEKLI